MRALYYLLGYDLLKSTVYGRFTSAVTDATDLDKDTAANEGYFAISQQLVDSIYDLYKDNEIIIVGHSLGGAIAQTTSMW